jgi:hypothetical protein
MMSAVDGTGAPVVAIWEVTCLRASTVADTAFAEDPACIDELRLQA